MSHVLPVAAPLKVLNVVVELVSVLVIDVILAINSRKECFCDEPVHNPCNDLSGCAETHRTIAMSVGSTCDGNNRGLLQRTENPRIGRRLLLRIPISWDSSVFGENEPNSRCIRTLINTAGTNVV